MQLSNLKRKAHKPKTGTAFVYFNRINAVTNFIVNLYAYKLHDKWHK